MRPAVPFALGALLAAVLPAAALAQPRALRLTNATGGPLVYVHLADAEGDWGAAVLDGDTLADGATRAFPLDRATCRYTLTAAAPDDALFTREDVDLCAPGGGAVTLTPDDGEGAAEPEGPTLTVLNEAGETAYTLSLRPAGTADWGADLLADGVFEPGDTLDLPLGALGEVCRVDVRATDAEGARGIVMLGLDVCDLAEIALPPFVALPEEDR